MFESLSSRKQNSERELVNSLSFCGRTGERCSMTFKPCGLFGKELHKVEGYILDKRYLLSLINNDFIDSLITLCHMSHQTVLLISVVRTVPFSDDVSKAHNCVFAAKRSSVQYMANGLNACTQ